jgi:uncharacterized iron-regulated membrane protein
MKENKEQKGIAGAQKSSKNNQLHKTIWRWHFYAGIIFAPILVLLAVTGSVYLFKAEIENVLYADYYQVEPQGEQVSVSAQLEEVQALYPGAIVTKYRPGEDEARSNEVTVSSNGESFTVFMDPYTGKSIGELKDDDRIMDKIEEIHGELMAGTLGDRIVELAACWTIVLMATGFFLWFPKKRLFG